MCASTIESIERSGSIGINRFTMAAGLPHRDAFAPSRTARRLAEWASGLPERRPAGSSVRRLWGDNGSL